MLDPNDATVLTLNDAQQALARRAHALGPGPVGVHPLHVPLVLFRGDIGGQQPGQQDEPVLAAVLTLPVLGRPAWRRLGSTGRRP